MFLTKKLLPIFTLMFLSLGSFHAAASVSSGKVDLTYFNKQKTYIAEANHKTGVSMELITAIAYKESNLGRNKRNKTSGTVGVMQFKPATWRASLKETHRRLGLPASVSAMNDRANILVGTAKLADNRAYLERQLGYRPSDGDVYMTHLLGLGGAVKVLKGNPNALVTKYTSTNKALTHRKGRPMTVKQFRQAMNKMIHTNSQQFSVAVNQARLDYVMASLARNTTSNHPVG